LRALLRLAHERPRLCFREQPSPLAPGEQVEIIIQPVIPQDDPARPGLVARRVRVPPAHRVDEIQTQPPAHLLRGGRRALTQLPRPRHFPVTSKIGLTGYTVCVTV